MKIWKIPLSSILRMRCFQRGKLMISCDRQYLAIPGVPACAEERSDPNMAHQLQRR
jgi:hypothetical protein